MKAKMTIVSVSVPNSGIKSYLTSQAGHNFTFLARVKVDARSMGAFSGEGIDAPTLEWNENIEWFDRTPTGAWRYVGNNLGNMYQINPTSNTFAAWHQYRYSLATHISNNPPPALKACATDNDAKHWIAKNGFEWTLQIGPDTPGMGLTGGSGGGGGASLVTGNTRRRVIYFDLGFRGYPARVKCVQILETVNGQLTIHKFINQGLPKQQVDDANNLARWRSQVNQQNWLP